MKKWRKTFWSAVYYIRYLAEKRYPLPPEQGSQAQLLVDVSVIYKHDSGTGIQRVVRAFLLQLVANPPVGMVVRPVFATKWHGYRYVGTDFSVVSGSPSLGKAWGLVRARAGDVFLGLDLAAHLIPRHQAQLLRWQACDVRCVIMVYDLLPDDYPQYFNPKSVQHFRRWLKFILVHADILLCISRTVTKQVQRKMRPFQASRDGRSNIRRITLGGDIVNSVPSRGMNAADLALLASLRPGRVILMVGTVEPRKAYDIVLNAMEHLWNEHPKMPIKLVIVGRHGWKADELERRLALHSEHGNRLFRLADASDELLERLYHVVDGLVMASYAEGFGLPVLEALRHGLPVLARDRPEFREWEGPGMTYFDSDQPEMVARSILDWVLTFADQSAHTNVRSLPDWKQAGAMLSATLSSSFDNGSMWRETDHIERSGSVDA